MLMPKLIRKELTINYAIQEKHKLMNGLANPPKFKEKLALRWKRKAFLLIQELIRL